MALLAGMPPKRVRRSAMLRALSGPCPRPLTMLLTPRATRCPPPPPPDWGLTSWRPVYRWEASHRVDKVGDAGAGTPPGTPRGAGGERAWCGARGCMLAAAPRASPVRAVPRRAPYPPSLPYTNHHPGSQYVIPPPSPPPTLPCRHSHTLKSGPHTRPCPDVDVGSLLPRTWSSRCTSRPATSPSSACCARRCTRASRRGRATPRPSSSRAACAWTAACRPTTRRGSATGPAAAERTTGTAGAYASR